MGARSVGKLAVAFIGVLFALAVAEVTLRALEKRAPPRPPPPAVEMSCGDCKRLYGLRPGAPGVSAEGLRDRSFPLARKEGVFRVLVLGDSVAYGLGVPAEAAFPKAMERAFAEHRADIEVLNGGVPGYSAYNEWRFYEEKGRAFHPDLVVLSTCMNDVADPVLHWASAFPDLQRLLAIVPEEAIPNPDDHHRRALPKLMAERNARARSPARRLRGLALYRLFEKTTTRAPEVTVASGGRSFPAQIVGEDTASLAVLDDEGSAEWKWLRAIYGRLTDAVHADGAKLAIVVNPLSYQLDPDYPLHPEQRFARWCAERGLACVDLIPALRPHRAEALYIGKTQSYVDIWHYTPRGHEIAGRAVAAFLEEAKLLPARR